MSSKKTQAKKKFLTKKGGYANLIKPDWNWSVILIADIEWSKKKQSKINFYVITESLILAQDERWRNGLGMQVERYLSFRG